MPTVVHTLDLNFQGIPNVIASYLIRHARGAVLIEAGPASAIDGLKSALRCFDLTPAHISDVFLSHIHLDHAGAAGWLARQGARIYVHPNGASHLIDPEKLLRSAKRIYGDMMDRLWGEFLPVPEDQLVVVHGGQELEIEGLHFRAIDTPGHADHHFAYMFENICFAGDVGGVRLPGPPHLRVPMPPPEFHLGKWRSTLQKLREEKFSLIAPTHFGIFDNVQAHLEMLERGLDEVEEFMERVMPDDPPVEDINARFQEWTIKRSESDGINRYQMDAYEAANPSWMSAGGIQRYWRKYRLLGSSETPSKLV
jgi:glyoxylase-like metal-dependent hydrolase (beta-lactamase superfamily II)